MRAFFFSLKRLGIATLALSLAVASLFAWALWPLPDPRFDWKAHYNALIAEENCDSAARLLGRLLSTWNFEVAHTALEFAQSKTCALSIGGDEATVRWKQDAQFYIDQNEAPPKLQAASIKWRPGWSGIWATRRLYARELSGAWFDYRSRGRGTLLDVPATTLRGWRCAVPMLGPGGAYFKARLYLMKEHGRRELRQAAWEKRYVSCYVAPELRKAFEAELSGRPFAR